MKIKNIISATICIAIAIILAVIFIGNASKNPLVGFWQEVNEYGDDIHIFEFNENDYLTEITLNGKGDKETVSYTYSFSKRSQTVVIMDNWNSNTYRYSISGDTLTLYSDDNFAFTWERINSINFLEKEQEERKEAERIRQEEEQRRREEEQRLREEEERKREEKLQNLREEYRIYYETPLRSAEIELIGKWVKDNEMFRDTYEFFEDRTVIYYSSDSGKTYTGTYQVYPRDINLSDEQLLQFEAGTFEPTKYSVHFDFEDDDLGWVYELHFVDDYIRLKSGSSYGWGWRFDRVS